MIAGRADLETQAQIYRKRYKVRTVPSAAAPGTLADHIRKHLGEHLANDVEIPYPVAGMPARATWNQQLTFLSNRRKSITPFGFAYDTPADLTTKYNGVYAYYELFDPKQGLSVYRAEWNASARSAEDWAVEIATNKFAVLCGGLLPAMNVGGSEWVPVRMLFYEPRRADNSSVPKKGFETHEEGMENEDDHTGG